ncbi:uncharacterized protein MYCFIDRAFT_173975 [Pseudocercospora fijiensis CIRAD86]|uniref:Yeast cell wall synthesis Kre9/Knh1-like N-terminal domain-containing protein n=1 Tax=Pseudocercospora fijiensis (strain CIRAD86) TaxID=383855 RepID=M3A1R4_PSEFD|nr:uncharacterized protein MYCFIDRAFT_173975 [Pseudocercospora fijiensis CIRAD86]EME85119.1 hypothetical protein MYCFIDRAFT_173975 [Pseudocercospora fijiensis CIRAD86]
MYALATRYLTLLAPLAGAALALDGIVAPSTIKAGTAFNITFQNANPDTYRVYLAASLSGSNGPTCYLLNTTTLNTTVPLTLTIPPSIGPSATYYTIGISDLTTQQSATFSNPFNLTSANGTYTAYENNLHSSPFWDPENLPCEAYPCARKCAMEFYPEDLEEVEAYERMKGCILGCEGVVSAGNLTGPGQATSTGASASASATTSGEGSTATEAAAAATSSGAANRNVYAAAAAVAGVGALAMYDVTS